MSVVSLNSTGHDAVNKVRDSQADVVVTEIRMPEVDGFLLLESLNQNRDQPLVPVVVFCVFENPTYVARSLVWGAFDFVLKHEPLDRLIAALRMATNSMPAEQAAEFQLGKAFVNIREQLSARKVRDVSSDELTDRELQVLKHLSFGLSNREIARSLKISVETAKEHVQNILRKQNSGDRTEAAVRAVRRGLGRVDF